MEAVEAENALEAIGRSLSQVSVPRTQEASPIDADLACRYAAEVVSTLAYRVPEDTLRQRPDLEQLLMHVTILGNKLLHIRQR